MIKGNDLMISTNISPFLRQAATLLAFLFIGVFSLSPAHADEQRDFFVAVEMDRPDLVEKLLKKGVDPNITEPHRGNTGLIIAMHEGSMGVFNLLVNRPGIDLNKRAENGNSAIMLAAWKSNVSAVKTLIEKGANVNQPGWSALHYAASVGNEEIVKMLLVKKATVDAFSPNKTTPLMMAARSGHTGTAKILLDNGADIRLRNEWDMSAVDFARDGDFTSLEKSLQSRLDKVESISAMKN
jgi:ankyrin repeat protein